MASRGHILVVDDERAIRRLLRMYLTDAGFTVAEAADGDEALDQVRRGGIDLVLLDLNLPEVDGFEVTRRMREIAALPVIMVTARTEEAHRVTGLELGADDYVVKPFSPLEVVARVKAVLRRAAGAQDPERRIALGDIEIEPAARRVSREGREVDLTRLEFDLLHELAAHPRVVYSRERLLEKVWGYQSAVGAKTVDVHVANLRRKLGDDLPIVAVRGVGYKIEPGR
ncbi:MAG TPA: response regulator transcription factor [Miltoncostaeaceae bacterium]|nr:response regulator transcription factor [Miltoncostaeaceae bacterium]